MTDEPDDRTFERWALAGAAVLALAGVAAFLTRRDLPAAPPAAESGTSDVLRVRIGGERPDTPAPPREPLEDERTRRAAPDPPAPRADEGTAEDDATDDPGDSAARTVVVQPGETLGQIAQRELGSTKRMGEIVELNGITDPDRIRAGTTLRLPPR